MITALNAKVHGIGTARSVPHRWDRKMKADDYVYICPKCGSKNIGLYDEFGEFACRDCDWMGYLYTKKEWGGIGKWKTILKQF